VTLREMDWGPLSIGGLQAVGLFQGLAPNLTDVRRHSPGEPSYAEDLRRAELVAGSLAVGLGTLVSLHEKSFAPLLFSGLTVLGLVCLYEYQFRTPSRHPHPTDLPAGTAQVSSIYNPATPTEIRNIS